MIESIKRVDARWWGIALLVLLTLAALALGYLASAALFPTPKIGIIHIDQIIYSSQRPYYTLPLNYAAEHDDIAAVVLLIDSPGGSAVTSEELFYRISQLRQLKPVVATVNSMAASGSYYAAVASNYIYSKPAALIGSIGVVSGSPSQAPPSEDVLTTGPFKGSGSSVVDWVRGMESIKEAFVTNVYDQRIYTLENMHDPSRADLLPDKDHLATGQAWIATVAYDIGLIDGLGSDLDAIQKAASLAGVRNYEVIDLTGLTVYDDPTFFTSLENAPPDWLNFAGLSSFADESEGETEASPWSSYLYLYLPPAE